jgi:uncharacterized membrane protein
VSTPTLQATSTSVRPTSAVRRYRLVVLLLVLALAASIAATIYLATRPSPTTESVPPGTSQPCYRQAVPC